MAWVNIVSPEAVNFLTAKIHSEDDEAWLPNDFVVSQPAQRDHDMLLLVATPPITTSTNPTAPRTLQEKLRSHQRKRGTIPPGRSPR